MKTYIRWGLIFSIVQTLFIAAEYLVGLHTHNIEHLGYGQLTFMIIAITLMTLGLRARKNEMGGELSYLDAIKMGWVVGFVSGVIAVGVFQFYLSYVNPEFFDIAKVGAVEFHGLTQAEAEMQYAYPNYLYGMFFFSQVAGIFTNAIVALFMKTKWKS